MTDAHSTCSHDRTVMLDIAAFAGELEICIEYLQKKDWRGATTRLKFIEKEAECLCESEEFREIYGATPNAREWIKFITAVAKLGEASV